MPHYALVTSDGDTLGPVELDGTEADMPNGTIVDVDGQQLRVVGYLEADPPEEFALLVVEET